MSFQQGLSGLNASSKNLEVIGNNIANANTYGAKTARAEFSHMYAAASGGVSGDIGIGVSLDEVSQQFTGGNITSTDKPTDLAISGSGFFQVSDGVNPTMYTRNGQFKVDRTGTIVNNDGMKLLGYPADANGNIQPGTPQALQLPTSGIQPKATGSISLELNLDSRAAVTASDTKPFNATDPTTYNNATSQTVYDAKGQPVAMTYYFQKADVDTWNVFVSANGTLLNDGAALTNQLKFGTNGSTVQDPQPVLPALASGGNGIVSTTTAATGTLPGMTTLDIPISGFDFSAVRQYGTSFSVTKINQDGFPPGNLTGLNIQDNGTVMAQYSNGQSLAAGQVELANFRNPQGLKPVAGNMWAISLEAGEPVRGAPGSGSLGKLQAGALEESNVDLAGELVNMITAQRSYQANAQTIKTQDQVLQTLVNLR